MDTVLYSNKVVAEQETEILRIVHTTGKSLNDLIGLVVVDDTSMPVPSRPINSIGDLTCEQVERIAGYIKNINWCCVC